MKWLKAVAFSLLLPLLLSSCSVYSLIGTKKRYCAKNEEKIISETLTLIAEAATLKDVDKMKEIFSANTQKVDGFEAQVDDFFEYVQGAVFATKTDTGGYQGASSKERNGRKTSSLTYFSQAEKNGVVFYIGIKECTKDNFVRENVGVVCLYVIDAYTYEQTRYTTAGWEAGIYIVGEK